MGISKKRWTFFRDHELYRTELVCIGSSIVHIYLCRVAHDVCYQISTGNNLFVITNKGKVLRASSPTNSPR